MNRSFVVLAPKSYNDKIKIEKLHLNIWYISEKEVYVDIGVMVEPELITNEYIEKLNEINALINEWNTKSNSNLSKLDETEKSLDILDGELKKFIKLHYDFADLKTKLNNIAKIPKGVEGLEGAIEDRVNELKKLKDELEVLMQLREKNYLEKDIELYIIPPFSVTDVQDLKKELSNMEVLQMIFNSEISYDNDYVGTDSDDFYLVNSYPVVEEGNKIKVGISVENRSEKHYFRIRAKLNIKDDKKNNLFSKRRNYNILNEYLYFDIRVNEKRLSPNPTFNSHKFCKIGKIYTFLVVPDHYKPNIDISKYLKNIRFLESENDIWNRYINKLKNNKDKFIVYFWKVSSEDGSEVSASITVLFEKLVVSKNILFVALLIIFHSDIATLMYLSQITVFRDLLSKISILKDLVSGDGMLSIINYGAMILLIGIPIVFVFANNIMQDFSHELKRIKKCIKGRG
ncbi:hypothetical protein [Methanococcus sp. CF]